MRVSSVIDLTEKKLPSYNGNNQLSYGNNQTSYGNNQENSDKNSLILNCASVTTLASSRNTNSEENATCDKESALKSKNDKKTPNYDFLISSLKESYQKRQNLNQHQKGETSLSPLPKLKHDNKDSTKTMSASDLPNLQKTSTSKKELDTKYKSNQSSNDKSLFVTHNVSPTLTKDQNANNTNNNTNNKNNTNKNTNIDYEDILSASFHMRNEDIQQPSIDNKCHNNKSTELPSNQNANSSITHNESESKRIQPGDLNVKMVVSKNHTSKVFKEHLTTASNISMSSRGSLSSDLMSSTVKERENPTPKDEFTTGILMESRHLPLKGGSASSEKFDEKAQDERLHIEELEQDLSLIHI